MSTTTISSSSNKKSNMKSMTVTVTTTTVMMVLVRSISQAMILLLLMAVVASAMLFQTNIFSAFVTTTQSPGSFLIGTHAFVASPTSTTMTRRHRHTTVNTSNTATITTELKARRTVVGSGGTEKQESEMNELLNIIDLKRMRKTISPSTASKHRRIRVESMTSASNVVDRRSFWTHSSSASVTVAAFVGLSIPQRSWADSGASKYPKASSISFSSTTSSLSVGLVEEGPERIKLKRKPSAPVGALVPSIQQRLLLEVCIDAAKNKDLQKLKSIIPPLSSSTTTSRNTRSSQSSNQLRLLKQNDPSRVLRGDVTRAAMDLYQVNLNYNTIFDDDDEKSDSSVTASSTNTVDRSSSSSNNSNNNADPSFPAVKDVIDITDPVWKKSYIRSNDGLNSDFVSKVIGADIDLRQLLRNQVQTYLDDAAAELYYVSGRTSRTTPGNTDDDDDNNDDDDGITSSSGCDCDELVELLQLAAKNFDLWLERVRYGDVREAIQMVLFESSSSSSSGVSSTNNIRIYESYQAGFIPPPPQTPPIPTFREPK